MVRGRRLLVRFASPAAFLVSAHLGAAPAPRSPDFTREVRPILADRCFRCHGPDESPRKRGLRLDTEAGSRALLPSGNRAIVPRDPSDSELVRRILADDPDDLMPPPDQHR